MFNPFTGPADDGTDTVFRDVIMLALAGFVMLVLLLLPHLNPPTKKSDDSVPGNVVVEIRWPDNMPADVDLWVQAPGDRPVGYSNASGSVFNLLRDDLGSDSDLSGVNMEQAYSRGAPDGEYTVNLHLFRSNAAKPPIPVDVLVWVRTQSGHKARVYTGTVSLRIDGVEETVVRFALQDGVLVPGSIHNLPKPLRSTQ